MTTNTLTPLICARLGQVFATHGWATSGDAPIAPFGGSFERFCHLMERLDDAERELVLSLTEDFLHCTLDRYQPLFIQACGGIPGSALGAGELVVFLSVRHRDDKLKVKSGELLAYLARCYAVVLPIFSGKSVEGYINPSELENEPLRSRVGASIIFVDDFIGTGESAITAINGLRKQFPEHDDRILVVSLVAQKHGVQRIEREGVPVFTAVERVRGISDSKRIADPAAAIALMAAIEDRLGVEKPYRLGYEGSEGLEAMLRTPDNTFPVFWRTNTVKGAPWPSPFPTDR